MVATHSGPRIVLKIFNLLKPSTVINLLTLAETGARMRSKRVRHEWVLIFQLDRDNESS